MKRSVPWQGLVDGPGKTLAFERINYITPHPAVPLYSDYPLKLQWVMNHSDQKVRIVKYQLRSIVVG